MKCPIDALKDIRDILTEEVKSTQGRVDEVASTGESIEFTNAYYKDLIKHIRDPEKILNSLEEREAAVKKVFHTNLRREVGEELYIEKGSKKEKYYLLDSTLIQDDLNSETFMATLTVAPASDLQKREKYSFDLGNDTSAKVTESSEIGTVEGISTVLQKAASKYFRTLEGRDSVSKIEDTEGDKEVENTLKKMTQVDNILGSRKTRNPDSLVGYHKIKDYKHGDIDSMKEILNRLHVLGGSRASDAQLKYYNGLFDKMHPRFFNNVSLYLKKNAADTFGHVNLDTKNMVIDVAAKRNRDKAWQSEAEVYTHEVVHTMTGWALRQVHKSVTGIITQLNHAMEVARSNSKWQDFLAVEESVATERDIKLAKDIMSYVFTSKNSREEFVAYTTTNPVVMKKMQNTMMEASKDKPTTVFGKVMALLGKLWNVVLGRQTFNNDISVYDKVNNLMFQLAEINDSYQKDLDTLNTTGKLIELFNNTDSGLAKAIKNLKAKIVKVDERLEVPSDDASALANVKFLIGMTVKAFGSPVHRKALGLLFSTGYGLAPGGTIREIASSFFERTDTFRIAEKLNMLSNTVDVVRNSSIIASSAQLIQAFKQKPSVEEESALTTAYVQTGLSSLRYRKKQGKKATDADIVKLLTDKEYATTQEGRVKYKIKEALGKDEDRAKWITAQAITLGHFMATGEGHIAMNTNADNIVKGFGYVKRFTSDSKLLNLTEELATIYALKATSQKDKNTVATMLKSEPSAMNIISDAYEAYKRSSRELLFRDSSAHMFAGHVKELFDDSVEVVVAPVEKESELAESGLTLRYRLEPQKGDRRSKPLAFYTSSSWGRTERLRGTVGLGRQHSKGTKLSDLKMEEDRAIGGELFKRDFAAILNSTFDIHKQMIDGTFDVTKIQKGMVPIYNKSGDVVDFRYMMNKENKSKFLEQDLRITQVLPRSIASIEHQMKRDELNKMALTAILKDMKDNWEESDIGKDGLTEYSQIGPDVSDPAMKELYYMLPPMFQEMIKERADKRIAVRKDLVPIYFGYRHMTLANIVGVHLLPTVMKTVISVAEGIWQEMIKISKSAILLKMPLILASNIRSNILLQISRGSLDLRQLGKDYLDSTREVNDYLTYNRKIVRLEQEIAQDKEALRRVRNTDVLSDKILNKMTELGRLQSALAANPAKELFDSGMYQTHVEEIENSALGETNRITKYVGGKLEQMPKGVRWLAETTYLTQNTRWYKFSQEVLQRSDMIARAVDNKTKIREEDLQINGKKELPEWWIAKQEEGYPKTKELKGEERKQFFVEGKEVRMQELIDRYINYTLPNGRFEEWANRMGILMFTKYLKRVQKVVMGLFGDHPLKATTTLLAINAMMDADMTQEQSLLARSFDFRGDFGLSNIVPMFGPLYHLENVFTPALVKEELRMGLF